MVISRMVIAAFLMVSAVSLQQPLEANQKVSLSPIGAISCRSGLSTWYTTGTLVVDSKTVLTVAHFEGPFGGEEDDGHPKTGNCKFTLYEHGGKTAFQTRFELKYRGGDQRSRKVSSATDWAVLRLEAEAPKYFDPLDVAIDPDFPRQREITLVASARSARGDSMPVIRCTAWPVKEESIVLRHDCPTRGGWSGAPLVVKVNGRMQALAIHTGKMGKQGIAVGFNGKLAERLRQAFTS